MLIHFLAHNPIANTSFLCVKQAWIEFWMLSHLWNGSLTFKTKEYSAFYLTQIARYEKLSSLFFVIILFLYEEKSDECIYFCQNRTTRPAQLFSLDLYFWLQLYSKRGMNFPSRWSSHLSIKYKGMRGSWPKYFEVDHRSFSTTRNPSGQQHLAWPHFWTTVFHIQKCRLFSI